jgi:prepilin peptidase CpaA
MLLAESLLVATCVLAAVVDHRRGVIPNTLAAGACGVALVVHVTSALGTPGDVLPRLGPLLLYWAGGALLTALVPLLLWKRKALGGGDLKLFAAIGAFLGPVRGLQASLYVFTLGALVGLVVLARQGALGAALEQVSAGALRPFRRLLRRPEPKVVGVEETWMRFGPTILVGTSLALFVQLGLR